MDEQNVRHTMTEIVLDKISTAVHDPILYKGKNFILVKFGLYMAVASFVTTSLFLTYLMSKGVYFGSSIIIWFTVAQILSIFGSKILHPFVLGKEFFNDPKKYLRQTAFYNQGGQVGIIIGMLIMSYTEKINPLLLLDAICYGACLALVIGRIGCYNYGCCYGKPTKHWLGIRYTDWNSKILRLQPELFNVRVIPMQLIHAAFDFSLFIVLNVIYLLQPQDGILCLTFGVCYNVFRMLTQRLRAKEINRHSQREEKIFIGVANSLAVVSLLLPTLIYIHYVPTTAIVNPLSLTLYYQTTFLNLSYLLTILLNMLICFVAYGYHKHLGEHI